MMRAINGFPGTIMEAVFMTAAEIILRGLDNKTKD